MDGEDEMGFSSEKTETDLSERKREQRSVGGRGDVSRSWGGVWRFGEGKCGSKECAGEVWRRVGVCDKRVL